NKIRAFNRFYTMVLGLLDNHLLDSHFTLPEARVMYEIYHQKKITAKEIAELLKMDKGYLSRILVSFDSKKLIVRKANKMDGRVQEISLSAKGEKEFLAINLATENQVVELLSGLSGLEIDKLVGHMDEIQKILIPISK
ncbi:MAG TPA: MarR family winged helix-turn-helix transcriptional regulator, partial [Niastella sp.]